MTTDREHGQRCKQSMPFCRKALSVCSCLLVFLLFLTVFPQPAQADAQPAADAELISRIRHVVTHFAPAAGTAWEQYLNERFYYATKLDAASATLNWNTANDVPAAWKWSGDTATLAAPVSIGMPASPLQKPYYDDSSRTYYVYSGEQLKFALDACSDDHTSLVPYPQTRTVSIQTHIDLNGQAGKIWPCVNEVHNVTILGNGHTVYNLRVDDSQESRTKPNANSNQYSALIGRAIGLNMEHLTFSNATICGDYASASTYSYYYHACGIIGFLNSAPAADETLILDVTVKDSLFVGADQVGGLIGRTSTTRKTDAGLSLQNCYSENNVCFGRTHISSLASSIVNMKTIDFCYSVDSIVISTAGHSGGLFSCGGGIDRISNCFVDAEVYGNETTGVFIGEINGLTDFYSCYSSGFVEGTNCMGGFIGYIPNSSVRFLDCYSTALVGLRSGGVHMGGFLGRRAGGSGSGSIKLQNCYAAGEVGFTGLDSSAAATDPARQYIGGMMGSVTSGRIDVMESCYYDKQTTAMREWGVGVSESSKFAVTGVLTTNSIQNGTGLTDADPLGSAAGFRGFTAKTGDSYPAGTVTGAIWDYSAEGHYPELTAFKSAATANWGTQDRANMVKAYSLSSTSTMKLDTWDYTLNKDTGHIDDPNPSANRFVYDTVRDLTSSFSLTPKLVDSWDRIGEADSRIHGESKSIIAGETLDVLSLKTVNGQYLCDELVPGIEWLMVTCSVGGQTATRRVRVIPTASIDAGLNAVITGLYDHADDVKLFYSTGKRIESDRSNVTTGVFPDREGYANAISPLQQTMLDNGKNTYSKSQTTTGNDRFYGASADYMGQAGENAQGSALYVYIYKVTGIEDGTSRIQTGERIPLADTNLSSGAKQFNGYDLLENSDQRYLIEYMWELKDGRVLADAKMVRRAKTPFRVALHLYANTISPSTLYPEGGYLYTGVNTPGGARLPLTDLTKIAAVGRQEATDAGNAESRETAQTAWKLKNPGEEIAQVQLIMQNGDPAISSNEVFTKTIDNPTPGQTISLPVVVYRIVYRNGEFYTIAEHVTRSYILQYDAASGVWHLEFDKRDEQSPENTKIFFQDVENSITVNVVVRHSTVPVVIPPTGDRQQVYLWLGLLLISLVGLAAVRHRLAHNRAKSHP